MRRSLMILAGAAVVAALCASSPFRAFLAFATEGCGGEGDKFVFEGSVTDTRKTVGTENIRDGKRKDVSDALEQGLTDLGADAAARHNRTAVRDSVHEIFQNQYDAFTHVESFYNRAVARHQPDNHVGVVTVTWRARVVILLPANADAQVTNHELGHLEIEKLLKDLANARFGAAVAPLLGQIKTDADVDAVLLPVKAKLDKIAQEAIAKYDEVTNHGTEGGEGQIQIATDTFNTIAAANP